MTARSPLSKGGVTLGITPRQRNVLAVIGRYIAVEGRPPLLRELQAAMPERLSLTYTADCVRRLTERGWLDRTPGKNRGMALTEAAVSLLASAAGPASQEAA